MSRGFTTRIVTQVPDQGIGQGFARARPTAPKSDRNHIGIDHPRAPEPSARPNYRSKEIRKWTRVKCPGKSATIVAGFRAAFNNPDYVSIAIGNYRWRQSLAPSEPEYASIENRLQQAPVIAVPTITIDGEYDPFTPPGNGAAYRDKFTGKYEHRVFKVGHNGFQPSGT